MTRSTRTFPPPLALRPGEFLVPLGSARIPPGDTAGLSTQPAADPATTTYTARPGDGTEEGERLTLLNDLLATIPGGATTVLWFDDRAPEVLHTDPTTPADDLVRLKGPTPPSTPDIAKIIAAAMKKEG